MAKPNLLNIAADEVGNSPHWRVRLIENNLLCQKPCQDFSDKNNLSTNNRRLHSIHMNSFLLKFIKLYRLVSNEDKLSKHVRLSNYLKKQMTN